MISLFSKWADFTTQMMTHVSSSSHARPMSWCQSVKLRPGERSVNYHSIISRDPGPWPVSQSSIPRSSPPLSPASHKNNSLSIKCESGPHYPPGRAKHYSTKHTPPSCYNSRQAGRAIGQVGWPTTAWIPPRPVMQHFSSLINWPGSHYLLVIASNLRHLILLQYWYSYEETQLER